MVELMSKIIRNDPAGRRGDGNMIEQKYHFVQLLSVRLKTASTYFDKVSFPRLGTYLHF